MIEHGTYYGMVSSYTISMVLPDDRVVCSCTLYYELVEYDYVRYYLEAAVVDNFALTIYLIL